jgi:predicted DNA-binding transcriptional regulator AlpA
MTSPIQEVDQPETIKCLSEQQAASFLCCSRALLRKWRRNGGGPPFIRLGRLVRYRLSNLQEWLNAR